ncbi:MAG: redoxin domain-containing protein [Planctomycetota bacterium]
MRRSLLCLAVITLAALLAVRFDQTAPDSDQVVAQEPPVAAVPARAIVPNPLTVPTSAEVPVLVDFIKRIREARPETEEEQQEYDQKSSAAIRTACERIIELDPNEASEARRFARRELLLFEVEDFAKDETVAEEDRKRVAAETVALVKASGLIAADAEFATTVATAFEDFAPATEAKALYQSLGEMFVHSKHEEIAKRGAFLEGAARRLGIVGKPFELTGQTINGDPIDIATLEGKIVLVEFWATWCGHCLDELPALKRHYQKYHDRGFEIVAISVDDDREELESFLKKQQLPWTIVYDEEAGSDHPATTQYGITAYPTSFLLDRAGRVIGTDLQGRKLSRKLIEYLGATVEKSPYPIFNINEVIDTITTEGARLHKQGKTRNDAQLRKQLNRKFVELELPEPSDEPIPDRELYRRASESVFVVCSMYKIEDTDEWQTSLATAFAVTADGVLTTSCHVFDNEDEADVVVVMDKNRKVYPVKELLAVNKKADTCLFRIDARDLKPLPLAEDGIPGTHVRVLGHPGDSFYFMSNGLLANYERDHDGTVWMNTTADFGQGSSGGPVMDEFGNVVGQVSRTFTLYAGGESRGRPRRVANDTADKSDPEKEPAGSNGSDLADPQMVFKSCVPVKTLRALVR